MKKGTASEEELKKLYDPNTFYEHGDNPAFKQFMNLSVENLREGKLTDHRTYVVDTYKKYVHKSFNEYIKCVVTVLTEKMIVIIVIDIETNMITLSALKVA